MINILRKSVSANFEIKDEGKIRGAEKDLWSLRQINW
jgi:hypothetical protein